MQSPLAVVLALAAATMFGLGNVLEHQVARTLPAGRGVSIRLLRGLARSPRWVLGMVNDVPLASSGLADWPSSHVLTTTAAEFGAKTQGKGRARRGCQFADACKSEDG